MGRRRALTRERIIAAAVQVADDGGLDSVSMRNVGKALQVEAMSLYHHIAGKDALLDDLADWWFTQVPLPLPTSPWRPAMEQRATQARAALSAHPWALGLIESRRTPGPALLTHHDAVLGCLRAGGFSVTLAAHAFSALDAYVYGFVLTELSLPFDDGESAAEFVQQIGHLIPADRYPHLAEMMTSQVTGQNSTYADEFAFGLHLILDSLERHLDAVR